MPSFGYSRPAPLTYSATPAGPWDWQSRQARPACTNPVHLLSCVGAMMRLFLINRPQAALSTSGRLAAGAPRRRCISPVRSLSDRSRVYSAERPPRATGIVPSRPSSSTSRLVTRVELVLRVIRSHAEWSKRRSSPVSPCPSARPWSPAGWIGHGVHARAARDRRRRRREGLRAAVVGRDVAVGPDLPVVLPQTGDVRYPHRCRRR